ncbi:MAG: glycosyltransferase family 2 protein [Hyphomicrobium sp.]
MPHNVSADRAAIDGQGFLHWWAQMTILGVIAIGLTGFGVVILAIVAVLFVEILAAFALPGKYRLLSQSKRPGLAVIVPAHDEALGIAATVGALKADLRAQDRLIVVADNCNDDTFDIANNAGAEAIRRHDPERRGKGFAMDFAIRHLAADPPEVVIFIDADCRTDADSLTRLAAWSQERARPVQALYEMVLQPHETAVSMKIAAFAWQVKNNARALGRHRMNLPCQLTGSGMAFPWQVVAHADLATGMIVEDIALGLALAQDGRAPLFCPESRVSSFFPASSDGKSSQRARWESGHLTVIRHQLPRLLMKAVRDRNLPLLALVVDAAVPPLALVALLLAAHLLASLMLAVAGGSQFPLGLAMLAMVSFAIGVFVAWWHVGRSTVSLSALAFAPIYSISKTILYARVLIGQKLEWVRTKRD